ncbi:TetR/AcrR family transcriptional regulator [Exilibacterium tricleocarpae]|uniref:TetR/AcrR family transcriptional regulator n=1 Tax=Exilibacterium tricleocarpae TaxID=2591008 RepID=A0A545SS06_9GAMM|nr:TetR/AcrR family transcriptional regulator [Exilibacterium tricleocarpae]TQV67751.1 TetR/AcrR family transcriptional regulator [Exilibacterium tricleocarpae]
MTVDTPVKTGAKKRTRLAPEKRRGLILDAAAKVVIEEGVSAVSMERLGRDANISKALVYNYFSNRNELLAALLQREFDAIRDVNIGIAETAKDFEEMVRLTTRARLLRIQEKGSLEHRLMSEPAVLDLVRQVYDADRQLTNRYLVKQVRHLYDLPLEIAIIVVNMCNSMTSAGLQFVIDGAVQLQAVEDLSVKMTLAALDAAAVEHGGADHAANKPLVK